MESSAFRIEPVREANIHTCVAIIVGAFSAFPTERRFGNTPDAEGIKAATQRHIRAWREHVEDTGLSPAICCIHRDSQTERGTIVACAEWFIYPKPHPRNDQRGASYLISGSWLPDEERTKLEQAFKSPLGIRAEWTAGRAYGLLMYMATDPAWRRKGAAALCVQWGIDRCRELGIPAYLEASKEGAPVYQRLGLEFVDEVHMELDGEKMDFPAMMWWPPGTKEEDKRKLAKPTE